MRSILSLLGAPDVVYDIRDDSVLLSQIREASLSSGPFGLSVVYGIVGSPEWWSAVESGAVPLETFRGIILRADSGQMGDSVIVRIQGETEIRSWTAWKGFNRDLIGKYVRVVFASIPPKHPPAPDFTVPLVIQINTLGAEKGTSLIS